jgi:hypothetical protein
MAVLLDGVDIETITDIIQGQRPQINTRGLGVHSLAISPNLKGTLHTYEVSGVWSNGNTDYQNKKRKIMAMIDSGLPVLLDASDWQEGSKILGKITNFNSKQSERAVDVDVYTFTIIAVISIGYTFVQDSGNGLGKMYGVDTGIIRAQSDTYNPILQRSNFTISATQMAYSFIVKNVGGSTGTIVLEIMVPDDLTSTGSFSVSAGWAKAVGAVGDSGFSSSPGTKRRAKVSKSLAPGASETVSITLIYASIRASYIDGSIDEILA